MASEIPLREKRIADVFDELRRAEAKHPGWPSDPFVALAIVGEEFGEAQQAALDYAYHGGARAAYYGELVQLAAMALRILFNTSKEPTDAQ